MSREEAKRLIERSARKFGAFYPVLLDAHGNVIEGYTRAEISKKWPTFILRNIKTPHDTQLARIHVHHARREISEDERKEQLKGLVKTHDLSDFKGKSDLYNHIAEETGFAPGYVARLLAEPTKSPEAIPEETRTELPGVITPPPPEVTGKPKRGRKPKPAIVPCPWCSKPLELFWPQKRIDKHGEPA